MRTSHQLTCTRLGIAAAALGCLLLPGRAGAESLGTAGGLKYVRASATIASVGMGTTSAAKTVQCGSGLELLGGGASVSGMPNGSYIGGTREQSEQSWLAVGWHLGQPERKITAFGVCTRRNVKEDASVGPIGAAPTSASHSVSCPSGQAVGGGVVGIGGDDDFFVNSTYPLGTDGDGLPDDAWNAWVAHQGGAATSILTGVQCLRNADLVYRERDADLDIATARSLKAPCPASRHVTGGGAYITGDSTQAHLLSTRPIDRGDGDTVPDDGWKAKAANPAGPAKDLTTYAICIA